MFAVAWSGSVTVTEFTVIPELLSPNFAVVTPFTKPPPVKTTSKVCNRSPLFGLMLNVSI